MPKKNLAKPKYQKVTIDVDPTELALSGLARFGGFITPKGYRFLTLIRKGTKATITFERVK